MKNGAHGNAGDFLLRAPSAMVRAGTSMTTWYSEKCRTKDPLQQAATTSADV